MIGLEDRQTLIQHIETAHTAGARLHSACAVAGISPRTIRVGRQTTGWHKPEYRHSGIRYVTPAQRHLALATPATKA